MARLNDLRDELVLVGGLVPTLLTRDLTIDADERHVGTTDLDLGFAIELVSESRYEGLADRLKRVGFAPNLKAETGAKQLQTWFNPNWQVMIDFLMPMESGGQPGNQPLIGGELAAFRTPGLTLAFRDRIDVPVRARVPTGGFQTVALPVCGPAAFVVLKAYALDGRSEPKDAYDLHYMIRYTPNGIDHLAQTLVALAPYGFVDKALEILDERFQSIDADAPHRIASFLNRPGDEDFLADVVGDVQSLLDRIGRLRA